jgi:phosphoribosyl-ATP pyrophosphohydrolase
MSAEKQIKRSVAATKQKKPSSSREVNSRVQQKKVEQKTGEENLNILPALANHARSGLQNLKRFGWDL